MRRLGNLLAQGQCYILLFVAFILAVSIQAHARNPVPLQEAGSGPRCGNTTCAKHEYCAGFEGKMVCKTMASRGFSYGKQGATKPKAGGQSERKKKIYLSTSGATSAAAARTTTTAVAIATRKPFTTISKSSPESGHCKYKDCYAGTCKENGTHSWCVCPSLFIGGGCNIVNETVCRHHCGTAKCALRKNEVVCICPRGYEGKNCATDINECEEGGHTCSGYRKCVNTIGSYKCECREGYTGPDCREPINFEYDKRYILKLVLPTVFGFGIALTMFLTWLFCAKKKPTRKTAPSSTETERSRTTTKSPSGSPGTSKSSPVLHGKGARR